MRDGGVGMIWLEGRRYRESFTSSDKQTFSSAGLDGSGVDWTELTPSCKAEADRIQTGRSSGPSLSMASPSHHIMKHSH